MDNLGLAQQLQKAYNSRMLVKNHSIRIPSGIKFEADEGKGLLHMDVSKCLVGNMQTDAAAFDAWIMIIKHWLPQYQRFSIKWDYAAANQDSGHYQRFLYRLFHFKQIFDCIELPSGWETKSKLSFINRSDSNDKYLINEPKKAAEKIAEKSEAKLERDFKNNKDKFSISLNLDLDNLDQQLPVGIFAKEIAKNNAVFTGGRSGIDLWGFSSARETLHIFELKCADKNMHAGILSELFFYTMVIRDLIEGNFHYAPAPKECEACRGSLRKTLSNVQKIRAWFLVEKIHPLLSRELVQDLNKRLNRRDSGAGDRIKIGWIKFASGSPLDSLEIPWDI